MKIMLVTVVVSLVFAVGTSQQQTDGGSSPGLYQVPQRGAQSRIMPGQIVTGTNQGWGSSPGRLYQVPELGQAGQVGPGQVGTDQVVPGQFAPGIYPCPDLESPVFDGLAPRSISMTGVNTDVQDRVLRMLIVKLKEYSFMFLRAFQAIVTRYVNSK